MGVILIEGVLFVYHLILSEAQDRLTRLQSHQLVCYNQGKLKRLGRLAMDIWINKGFSISKDNS